MRIHERGEKGFTLIELLIVIAILGVLAAVVIPNVGRFIGRGETEAAATELANIQSAVVAMMVDNNLATLAVGDFGAASTDNMSEFPDSTPANNQYILYGANVTGAASLVNYVVQQTTSKFYTVDSQGTVVQWENSGEGP